MAKVKDKATAFKNELSGSATNKIVCKASSHEVAGPKKKHVDCKYDSATQCICTTQHAWLFESYWGSLCFGERERAVDA